MLCPYCEEYDVDDIPEGSGTLDNVCTECGEYTIPTDDDYLWLSAELNHQGNDDESI